MTKKSDLIKKVVKTNVGEKPTFGTDPRDPWSARAGITEETINETALLNRYLKSRGINPEFVSKDQKVAHSKTNQFKVWMQAHVNDPIKEGMSQEHTPTQKKLHSLRKAMHYQKEIRVAGATKQLHTEAVDKRDVVAMDIPLLIRMLEYAREDAKTDMDLHKVVEKLIKIRNKGTLTMKDYKFVTSIREEFFHGSAAAVGMPFDGANNTDDTIPAKVSASKVKSLVKKIKEEMYDHEKEDKPVTTPRKKTALQKLGIDATTRQSPPAAAVLSGGKTLTGEPRDTIEIDPMMKMKKPSPNSQKSV